MSTTEDEERLKDLGALMKEEDNAALYGLTRGAIDPETARGTGVAESTIELCTPLSDEFKAQLTSRTLEKIAAETEMEDARSIQYRVRPFMTHKALWTLGATGVMAAALLFTLVPQTTPLPEYEDVFTGGDAAARGVDPSFENTRVILHAGSRIEWRVRPASITSTRIHAGLYAYPDSDNTHGQRLRIQPEYSSSGVVRFVAHTSELELSQGGYELILVIATRMKLLQEVSAAGIPQAPSGPGWQVFKKHIRVMAPQQQ